MLKGFFWTERVYSYNADSLPSHPTVYWPSRPTPNGSSLRYGSDPLLFSGMGLCSQTLLKAFLNKGVQIGQSINNKSLKWCTPFYTSHSQGQRHLRLTSGSPPVMVPRLSLPVLGEHFPHRHHCPRGALTRPATNVLRDAHYCHIKLPKNTHTPHILINSTTLSLGRWLRILSAAQISEFQTLKSCLPLDVHRHLKHNKTHAISTSSNLPHSCSPCGPHSNK